MTLLTLTTPIGEISLSVRYWFCGRAGSRGDERVRAESMDNGAKIRSIAGDLLKQSFRDDPDEAT